MNISSLKMSITGDELMQTVYRKTANMDDLRIRSIKLRDGNICIGGGFNSVKWSIMAQPRFSPLCGDLGLDIVDVSIDSILKSLGLSIISGLQSRERWIANKIVQAVQKTHSQMNGSLRVYSVGSTVWVDVKKLAEHFGVTIGGTISRFSIGENSIELEVCADDVLGRELQDLQLPKRVHS